MNSVRLLATAYTVATAVTMALGLRMRSRLFRRDPGRPMPLLGLLPIPRMSAVAFDVSGVFFVAVLLLAAAGWQTRWMLAVALVLYVFHFGQILDRSGILKKTNLTPLYLGTLLVAPGLDAPWTVTTPHWPVIATQALLACTYFAAGLAKLRNTGLRWATGEPLRAYLVDNYLWREAPVAWWVARHRTLCALMSGYTLAVELLFPLALSSDVTAGALVLAAIAMHLGIHAVMGINYLRYWWPNYLPFGIPLLTGWYWPA
ncbi:hypothetical protein AB5J72_39560 [Streptomyces sp. CG1]|uniref:hypothetical protein n=1 Tax=Streptomyces sp. CG1 TaxID=1287523 RepID=UPI0034E2430C